MNYYDSLGPRLEISTDDKPRRSVSIGDNGIQIGRDPTVSVRFEDARISRQHARIERHADGAFYLVDTSKHQATYLNGRRLLEARPVRLGDGDRIRVGDYEMIFRCESRVLPVEAEAGSTVLETLGDLSSDHLAARAGAPPKRSGPCSTSIALSGAVAISIRSWVARSAASWSSSPTPSAA